MNKLNWMINRHVLSALCAAPLLLNGAYALAEEAAPALAAVTAPAEPAPPYTLSFNLGLYSNYMFRGVNLSDGPAVQGGIDYAHSSGLYAGTWFSTIDPQASAGNHQEVDLYAGYAHTFDNGFGVNFMGNYYWYPDSYKVGYPHTYDTFEASAGVSYKFLTYTYYNILTKYYGASNSKNAEYHELKAAYKLPVGDLNLLAKVGYTNLRNLSGDQGDFTIGLNRDFSLPGIGKPIEGFNAGAYYTDTFSVDDQSYYVSADGRDTNSKMLTFYIKRTW
jgi:uncharacterized protein (TIGR02001 family)